MKFSFLLAITLIINSGCASIFCGDSKIINVSSNPPGAKFKITSIHPYNKSVVEGITPMNVTLKRGSGSYMQAGDYLIEFEKNGYEKTNIPIKQGLETGWYLGGNIIVFGGLIGLLIVDPVTGAMWNIYDVHADLKPSDIVTPEGKTLKVRGYTATIDNTGKPVITPVYEE